MLLADNFLFYSPRILGTAVPDHGTWLSTSACTGVLMDNLSVSVCYIAVNISYISAV